MAESENSWNAFSSDVASTYLRTYGSPAVSSKCLLLAIIKTIAKNDRVPRVLDLGCGNGQLLEFFKQEDFKCNYTGVDFSRPLLDVARNDHHESCFIEGDIGRLSSLVSGRYDLIIYSHVLEMLESPEQSLLNAKSLSDCVIVRFFEPPEFELDSVELCQMNLGKGSVPYLRRKMSKSYYQLILSNLSCKRVDVYRDISHDQVHVLYF